MPSLRDLDPRHSWPGVLLAAGCVLTLVFTLLRPDASDGLSAPGRLLFWAAHVFLPLALLQGAQLLLLRWPRVAALNPWLQTALSGLLGAAAFTPLALLLDWLFGTADDGEGASIAALADEFAALFPVILLVWLGLNATRLMRLEPVGHDTPAAAPGVPGFWDRVPRALGRDLVALSAELHYLRVRTTGGEALILYPFGKAVAELAATGSGQQIHRSHWVTTAQVAKVDRRGQGALCTLATGLSLPVSRQYRAEFLAAVSAEGTAPTPLRA
jgi:LytTr DNA-binding domain